MGKGESSDERRPRADVYRRAGLHRCSVDHAIREPPHASLRRASRQPHCASSTAPVAAGRPAVWASAEPLQKPSVRP